MGVRNRTIAKKRWKLAGASTCFLFLGGLGWLGTDKIVSSVFQSLRPELEQQLAIPLGHNLKLGPYLGLRPWGLALGESEIFKGPKDDSTGKFSSLRIAFAPFASFLHWRPVVKINFNGAVFNLQRNIEGSYWVPGQLKGGTIPKVDIRFGLSEPAKVFLSPANLELSLKGRGQAHFSSRRIGGEFQLEFPEKGKLFLQGQGSLDDYALRVKTRAKEINLTSLQELFSRLPFKSKGKLNGDLRFVFDNGRIGCNGNFGLLDFSFKKPTLKYAISSPNAHFTCADDRLIFNKSDWFFGGLTSTIGGDFLFNYKPDNFNDHKGLLRLSTHENLDLMVMGALPIAFNKGIFSFGELNSVFSVRSFQLAKLNDLLGVEVSGQLNAVGKLDGELERLNANFKLDLESPQFSFLRLQEKWEGAFIGNTNGGGVLSLASAGDVIPSNFSAEFEANAHLKKIKFIRGDGWFALDSIDNSKDYLWEAEYLKLDGLEFALPPSKRFERLFGNISGVGRVSFSRPLFEGKATFGYPRIMGIQLRKAVLEGNYFDNLYTLNGGLYPPDIGEVTITAKGLIGGKIDASASARGVSARWMALNALQLPRINVGKTSLKGDAKDLGTYLVDTFGGSIDGQLKALSDSKSFLQRINESTNKRSINPQDLKGEVDADVVLQGPNMFDLDLSLSMKGYVSTNDKFAINPKELKPFTATLNGPINSGKGSFSILNVPFSLLALIAPLPKALNGGIGISGKYQRIKKGFDVTADLILDEAKLGPNSLVMEKSKVSLSKSIVSLDLSMRSTSSSESVELKGVIPLKSSQPMDIRVESHGDGLNFLTNLIHKNLNWRSGKSDLRLLIRGTPSKPLANGFLFIEDSEFVFNKQLLTDLNSTIIFDFNRLEMQYLNASVGEKGLINASGSLALLNPTVERNPLVFDMKDVRLTLPVANADISGNLILTRSLLNPTFGGEIKVYDGFISPGKSGIVKTSSTLINNQTSKPSHDKLFVDNNYSEPSFIEKTWDFQEPLVLLGRDVEARASKVLRSVIPSISSISFDNLRMIFGPNLSITSQPLANFRVTGLLTLNGDLGPSLQPKGVVRLLNGRVNLFTTTFSLDRKAPNVAVFTPSLGLVPYVDVTLKSRVAESADEGSNITSTDIAAANGNGTFGAKGFRLIKVVVQATGPADRIAENIELRSTPPMPRAQLLGLIGGNTLAGLSSGGDSEMIATVLGRSLLSPVLGTISDSFDDRLQISLYPTYVTPEAEEKTSDVQANSQENDTGQASPQQAWVTEIGIDLTDKFNFSVLATPNRDDIPPQGTLTYQVTDNLGLAGSLDKEGTWQSQLQLFFRF